jgi:tight adherence protein B
MMRARAALAIVAALSALAATTPSALGAVSGLRLAPVAGARFPDRAFVLSLPSGMSLDQGRVDVRENGDLVSGLSVVPAFAAEKGEFAVVLVIDASDSMRGEAIQGALDAARAFAAQRTESQQVAVVAFNDSSTVLLPLTTSQEAIEGVLGSPPNLSRGTHIYDAVSTAITLLADAKVTAGSVILLSDGADTGSRMTEADVAAAARAAHVRIFSVGLRSRQFQRRPLESLAAAVDGDYSEAASSPDLKRIFDQLGVQLASEYLLRYRSAARPHALVHVSVRVEGVEGIATSQYQTPGLASEPGSPFHRAFGELFWQSVAGMLLADVTAAVLIAIALVALVRPRRRTLRARMAEFVSISQAEREGATSPREAVLAAAERSFAKTRWWARLKEVLELAGIRVSATQIVLSTVGGALVVMWLLTVLGGSVLYAPLGLAVPFAVRGLITRKLQRQRDLFADQLPDNLQVLSSALRAGHSLVGALSVLVEDCAEPSRGEFRRVIADEQLGVPLEQALDAVARRMASRDLEQVALVAAVQRDTGGNTAEVLDRVAETVRGRFELRRLVKTLTTQGRMSRWIVSGLPVVLLVLITALNPKYVAPLYTEPLGRALLVVAGVMVVAGSLVIKKIVNIKT